MVLLTNSLFLDAFGIVTALIAVIYAYFKWSFQYWKKKGVPYLEPSIPFGTFASPFSDVSQTDNILRVYRAGKAKGARHCGLYQMMSPMYLPLDLELLKNILTKDFQHFVDRGVYVNEKDDPIGAHLFALGGKKWKNLRAKLTPTFTSGKMKTMVQTVVDYGLVLEKYMEGITSKKEPVDIKEVLGCFTADVIGSCAFGLDCNSFKEPNSPFRIYGQRVFSGGLKDVIRLTFANGFPSVARLLGLRQINKEIGDFYKKVVDETVSYREKNNVSRKDFLQLLIEMKNKGGEKGDIKGDGKTLTMDEILAQCFVFFIAGFETSSTTMTFALFELAAHPELQDKVREEIKTVLGKHDNRMTYDSLNELTYMKQVIDETLRKYPPIPAVTRVCVQDYKVPGENLVIEKGTTIFIPIVGIHYDEEYYDNPSEFDPERFNAENKKTRNQYAHIPFGEGPRICIGERFGVMQSKVGLTCILRNYKVTVNKRTQVPIKTAPRAASTTALGGIWLDFEKI